jgi:hypothetical protein
LAFASAPPEACSANAITARPGQRAARVRNIEKSMVSAFLGGYERILLRAPGRAYRDLAYPGYGCA